MEFSRTESPAQPSDGVDGEATISAQALPIALIIFIFFANLMVRIGLGPLLPEVETGMGLDHAQAGGLFLFTSLGFSLGMFGSGLVSSRLTHRRVIALSALASGAAMLGVAFAPGLGSLRSGLVVVGLSCGIYLPSGVACLTGLVRSEAWGKVLSIQQLAPNLAFVAAPFLAQLLVPTLTWRETMGVYGLASVLLGLTYAVFGRGGDFKGDALNLGVIKEVLGEPAFRNLALVFSIAIGANQGLFTILTLYLHDVKGMSPDWSNTVIGLTRIAAFAAPLLGGMLGDRVGYKRAMMVILGLASLATIGLTLVPAGWVGPVLFCQSASICCFFPLGFAAISSATGPTRRNVAISLVTPIGTIFGAGAIPAVIGALGDHGFFNPALLGLAVALGCVVVLLARTGIR